MIRHEAHIKKDWREHGLAHLLVARIHSDGAADVGVFLVDVFCLGVKDAFLEADVPASELKGSLPKIFLTMAAIACTPRARKN